MLRELLFKDDERALTNYFHLFEILLEEARATGCGLTELVATLDGYIRGTRKPPAQDGDVQRLESDRDAVQVMSIHKSKGLEAAVVFLYGGFTAPPGDGLYEYHDRDPPRARRRPVQRRKGSGRARAQGGNAAALLRRPHAGQSPALPPVRGTGELGVADGTAVTRRVNDRLAALLGRPEAAGLFVTRRFRDEPIRRGPSGSGEEGRTSGVLAAPAQATSMSPIVRANSPASESATAAYEVTSYSRMKQTGDSVEAPIDPDEFYRELVPAIDPATLPEGELPGGRATGTLLHEILEKVPFDETAAAPDLDAWRKLDSVARVVDEALTKGDRQPGASG